MWNGVCSALQITPKLDEPQCTEEYDNCSCVKYAEKQYNCTQIMRSNIQQTNSSYPLTQYTKIMEENEN
jgi:hypothetical protein